MRLSFGDRCYLDFKKGTKVSIGDKFHVVEKLQKVKDPDKWIGKLGWLIRKKAVIRIVALHKATIEGIIVDNESAVMRGDKVIPYVSPFRSVIPFSMKKDLKGKIVAAENQQYLISNQEFRPSC